MSSRIKEKMSFPKIKRSINSWQATCETLSGPQLLKDIKEGLDDIKAGRSIKGRIPVNASKNVIILGIINAFKM